MSIVTVDGTPVRRFTNVGAQGPEGAQGPTGATGATGPQGDPGPGLPAGGTTGQFVKKASATDYDTAWASLAIADISDAGTAAASDTGDFAAAAHQHTLSDVTDAGTAAASDIGDFAAASDTPRVIEAVTISDPPDTNGFTFADIPQTFTHLQIVAFGTGANGTAAAIRLQFNGDTGKNYDWAVMVRRLTTNANGTLTAAEGTSGISIATLGTSAGSATVELPGYSSDTFRKTVSATSWAGTNASIFGQAYINAGQWRSTAPITSISVSPDNGQGYEPGSTFTLIGIP